MTMFSRCVTIAALVVLGGCTVWPVDQDPKGMGYRRSADGVVEALQNYRRDKGAFPPTLAALTPAYLPTVPDEPRLDYHGADGSLAYHYTPSWPQLRPVWCASVADTTEWRCQEHIADGLGTE